MAKSIDEVCRDNELALSKLSGSIFNLNLTLTNIRLQMLKSDMDRMTEELNQNTNTLRSMKGK